MARLDRGGSSHLMRVILDASTALAAVLPDEDSTYARAAVGAAVGDGLVVPTLWLYDIQNGLATAVRRQRIDRGAILASNDDQLRRTAESVGVPLFEPA